MGADHEQHRWRLVRSSDRQGNTLTGITEAVARRIADNVAREERCPVDVEPAVN